MRMKQRDFSSSFLQGWTSSQTYGGPHSQIQPSRNRGFKSRVLYHWPCWDSRGQVYLCCAGLSCALQDVEQHPWPLPTRFQLQFLQSWQPKMSLNIANVPWWGQFLPRVKNNWPKAQLWYKKRELEYSFKGPEYSFSRHLLSPYYLPETLFWIRDTTLSKQSPDLMGLTF